MIELIKQYYAEYASSLFLLGKGVYFISGAYGVYSFIRDWRYVRVKLSIGAFSIRHKDLNVQNVTNLVSALFYGGGQVPADVREEIIRVTMPRIKDVAYHQNTETT